MSSRRDRRHGGEGEVRRRESDRRSADHCSSDEYEDYDRVQVRRSDHRHHRPDSRSGRSRSRERNHSHHRSSQSDSSHRHADDKRSRHRHHHRSSRSEVDEELEEGQYLPGEDDEDNEQEYQDRRHETPNNTIMLRGLPPEVMENDILAEVARYGLNVREIRLMRHKETGVSRGFAFVEFASISESSHWKRVTQGHLDMNGHPVSLHFSFSKELMPDGSAGMQRNDWTCYKCGVNNFKRRDVCFKCETGRDESEANDTGDEISPTPTNCLILRNLSSVTTADQILTLVSSVTNAPIRSIRFPKDPVYNMPRGVCYLELHTSADSIQLMALISDMDTSFLTDSAPLIINYAKRSSAATVAASVSTNAASAALAAAHWTNQTSSTSAPTSSSLGVVSVNGVTYNKFPKPDLSTFQLETSSGFYYDSSTRLYYDPKSTYYFNSVTQQYLYWSDEHQTYLPPEQPAASVVVSDSSARTDKTPDKVKSAKKIAKDMERWAKTLNQKTFVTRANPEPAATSPLTQTSSHVDDIATPASQVATEISPEPEVITIDPVAVRREEEKKLTDWSKLLCLLCKRQFTSADQLTKHQQVSDLHRSNLDAKMRSILSMEQMDALIRRDGQYMDRAGDRRRKWGNNEPVERNLVKEQYMKEMEKSGTSELQAPITGENKGSKMLKAMGWTEGQGLGKKKSGRTEIIHVEQRVETAGLGAKVTVMKSGETYKDAVRRAAAQRYKELLDQ